MAGIFDNLSDQGSMYNSEFERYIFDYENGSYEGEGDSHISLHSLLENELNIEEESAVDPNEDPIGPDSREPSPSPSSTRSLSPEPAIRARVQDLPLRQPAPIHPPSNTLLSSHPAFVLFTAPAPIHPPPSGVLNTQAISILTNPSVESLASAPSRGNTVGARCNALALWDTGIDPVKVKKITGVSQSGIYKLHTKAIDRGWVSGKTVEIWMVDNAPRSGRPGVSKSIVERILSTVTRNSTTRGWSCGKIAGEIADTPGVSPLEVPSASTIYRTLKKAGYAVYKRTVKPGLNKDQKEARNVWCKVYTYWTIEDWKNVIFTDETSVQKGSVRGKRRVWRLPKETHHKHVITRW